MYKFLTLPIVLTLFDANTNVTTDVGLSDAMKTYYSDYLIDLAEAELVHDQFAQKHPIPRNSGKTIEFRKYNPLPKALTPLTEGVTPDGQKISLSTITATVKQYGGYVTMSDILLLTAIDNQLVMATELLGSQAGRTSDTITREVLAGGTNVLYSGGKEDRSELVGGDATAANNSYLSVEDVRKAARFLKVQNARPINGNFVAIIHPDVSFDLTHDKLWEEVKTYDPSDWYNGEIGRIAGVRFVESTEAKIFHADDLLPADGTATAVRNLTVKTATTGAASATLAVKEAITAAQATAIEGRDVMIGGELYTVVSAANGVAGSATVTIDTAIEVAADAVIYPGEAGKNGRDVYATIVFGANAYGTTELSGGGLQHIVKQLGSAGSADPLDQRASAGWKLSKVTERLVEQYMIRIESASTYESGELN